jgi:SNF2 family DNA or RNA helicase
LDSFIVDDDEASGSDDASDAGWRSDAESASDAGSGSSSSSDDEAAGGGKSRKKKGAEARAPEVSGFSDEWCDWAGEGSEIEGRLVADLRQRGAEASCKSAFVCALLDELVGAGHRVLIFSQSRVMLDILQVCACVRACMRACVCVCVCVCFCMV